MLYLGIYGYNNLKFSECLTYLFRKEITIQNIHKVLTGIVLVENKNKQVDVTLL